MAITVCREVKEDLDSIQIGKLQEENCGEERERR